jgi:hypothetical protein
MQNSSIHVTHLVGYGEDFECNDRLYALFGLYGMINTILGNYPARESMPRSKSLVDRSVIGYEQS